VEGSVNAEDNAQAGPTKVVRFDATIELNAPILKSHVVLFARYWVAPSFYKIAVLWAEPHALNLNFPMYPVTMMVDSNEETFSVANQIQGRLGATFTKPVDKRPIFRHRLNSYPAGEMRFTETEALASRIYRDDVDMLGYRFGDGSHVVDLPNSTRGGDVERDIAAIDLGVAENRVDSVDIVDANNLLVKRIAYEYSQDLGCSMLRRQEVLLPERPLLLGYGERGVTIRVNDTERTFKELYGLDHEGGRKCGVQYEPFAEGTAVLPMPSHIVVQRADNGVTLRTAQMSNFVLLMQSAEDVDRAARQVGHFRREELRTRSFFAKYWHAEPNGILGEDAAVFQHLREHFENRPPDETVGERLRRINMLMQLAWLRGDGIVGHFREYLVLLADNGLHQAAFLGGLNAIDTSIRRKQFSLASELLREWTHHAVDRIEVETLLTYARAQIKKGHTWTVAQLLAEGAKSGKGWTEKLFDVQALRCIALHELRKTICDPTRKKTQTAAAQAVWASASLDPRDLQLLVGEAMTDAQRLFKDLAKPESAQKTLKQMLDTIDEDMRNVQISPSPEAITP